MIVCDARVEVHGDGSGLRQMLRWAGLPVRDVVLPTAQGCGCVRVIDAPGLTLVTTADEPRRAREAIQVLAPLAGGSTVLVKTAVVGGARMLFPLIDVDHHALAAGAGLERAQEVLVTGGPRHVLGVVGRWRGHPLLALGFSLAALARQATEAHWFYGWGQLVALLRWFVERVVEAPCLLLSPWREGRQALVTSFDVEAAVGRRSLGKCVFCVPAGSRNLIEVRRLTLVSPLRGKRLRWSRALLHDPDGCWPSYRLTVDRRPGDVGSFALPPRVEQWQAQWLIPRRKPLRAHRYQDFAAWTDRACPGSTCFYSGARTAPAAAGEAGFHGFDHQHFIQMGRARIRRELADAAEHFFRPGQRRLARAPGLLWSEDYFRALGDMGYQVDSSFREVNFRQPLLPVRVDAGWWEVPVTGSVGNLPDDLSWLRPHRDRGGVVSVYAHDFELATDADRARYLARVEAMEAAGFARTGVTGLVDWLEASADNRVTGVEVGDRGRVRLSVRLAEGSMVSLLNPGAWSVTAASAGWRISGPDDAVHAIYTGGAREGWIELGPGGLA